MRYDPRERPSGKGEVLAQLDRASGFEPEGRGFESLKPHQK